MKIKNIITILLITCILASCAPAAATVPLTETAIPILTFTVTPYSTATATIAPSDIPPAPEPTRVSEVTLNGLIPWYENFPTVTDAQEQAKMQTAYENPQLDPSSGNTQSIQLSEQIYNDLVKGVGVRFTCYLDQSCAIRDSYIKMVHTPNGDMPVHKVLLELYVAFEDGSQGSVIVPYVIDPSYADIISDAFIDVQFVLDLFAKREKSPHTPVDFLKFQTTVSPGSRPPNNPVMIALSEAAYTDPETSALLDKAHTLAKEGKFLTQAEINVLTDAFLLH